VYGRDTPTRNHFAHWSLVALRRMQRATYARAIITWCTL